ncbi:tripartite tricarboxylate transporter permease [uncultured Modestobacter sp.]|uniref:tripartite tricarboxylate transporter permease n=1 Tax=uncultured Modestobacter sp. TaxID=380048 RepID=UPI0026078897|nr:tripartite tricarboxylate transporter permease [uncultured Modestobacter sp.]
MATAAIGSFVAGTIATVLLALVAPTVVELAIGVTSADYFALAVIAFVAVATVLGSSPLRGLASLCLGLYLGLVGTDVLTGQERFTLGIPQLSDGIDVVVVAVALFAVGEALHVASRLRRGAVQVIDHQGSWMTRQDFRRSWAPWLRGTAFGFPLGALPAGGAEIPTFLSYATERKLTKHPEEFGKGAIEGVAGPEAANNAAAAGVLVPLLTLGIPTSATAAIILAAFQGYGIQPGPTLLTTEGPLVWALIASLLIGNAMLLVLNLPLVGLWVKLLRIPRPYLYAGILAFASLGSFAVNADPLDLVLLLLLGLLGFVMRRYGWPVAPAVIGLILGPIAETNLRRALAISNGDLGVLVDTWFSRVVLALAVLALVGPIVLRAVRGPRPSPAELQHADAAADEDETVRSADR